MPAPLGSAAAYPSAEPIQGGQLPQTSPLVNYRYARDPAQCCGTCKHFQPPGACELVTGMIRPVDTCDLWDGDPSGQRIPVQAALVGAGEEGEEAGTAQGAKKGWATRKGGGGSSRAVWAKEPPEGEEERQVAKFARSERPQVRAERVAKTPVSPVRAQVIKRAFGWQAERERSGPVRAELLPVASFERFKAVASEAGTSQGAKKGWMSRKGGGGAPGDWTAGRSQGDIAMIKATAKRSGLPEERAAQISDEIDRSMKHQGYALKRTPDRPGGFFAKKEAAIPGIDAQLAALSEHGWVFHANDHDSVIYHHPESEDEVRVWGSGNWIWYTKDQRVVTQGQGPDALERALAGRRGAAEAATSRFRRLIHECRRSWRGLLEAFNPRQARDRSGRWTSGGAAGARKGKKLSPADRKFVDAMQAKGMSRQKAEKLLTDLDKALKGKGQLPSAFRYGKE